MLAGWRQVAHFCFGPIESQSFAKKREIQAIYAEGETIPFFFSGKQGLFCFSLIDTQHKGIIFPSCAYKSISHTL